MNTITEAHRAVARSIRMIAQQNFQLATWYGWNEDKVAQLIADSEALAVAGRQTMNNPQPQQGSNEINPV